LWRVQKPDGSFTYFGDARFGGKNRALRAALLQLRALPIIGIKKTKSASNKSGTIGVCAVRYKGETVAFKAIAGSKWSKSHYKAFSIRDYGENVAFRLACLARAEFIGKMEDKELMKRNRHISIMLAQLGKRGGP
jgi:hypothetical protein